MDMLKGITWGQFSIFIMVVTGGYYLYVFFAYYRAEALTWLRGSGGERKVDVLKGADNNRGSDGSTPKAAAGQVELFKSGEPSGGGDERFQAMQRAIGVIRQVIAQGIENKLDRENLLDHIKEVLGSYRQLRQTEYAETINNFLIRVCAGELSLELGEGELAGLWK